MAKNNPKNCNVAVRIFPCMNETKTRKKRQQRLQRTAL